MNFPFRFGIYNIEWMIDEWTSLHPFVVCHVIIKSIAYLNKKSSV